MLCADAHKAELLAAGFDPRKAHCDKSLGLKNWELCYDPTKLIPKCSDDTACSDGNVCNGVELCNVISGVCEPGPALDCDDSKLCTTDTCDPVTGCIHTVTCGENEICGSTTGACEFDIYKFRPCIAVNDDWFDSEDSLNNDWSSFLNEHPNRPFCLLRPLDPSVSYNPVRFPTDPDFLSNPNVIVATVNRDEGDPALASDWLAACNYTDLSISDIDFVGLYVDETGSMTRDTVRASLNKFYADLTAASKTYCSYFSEAGDWIESFYIELYTVDSGGVCVFP